MSTPPSPTPADSAPAARGAAKREIPAEVYDREFFLSPHLEGYEEFLQGGLSVVKARQLELLAISPDLEVLEIGYGRGELLRHCALRGARVTGVDYAGDAADVARETLRQFPEADLRVADSRRLPFEADCFDRVFSGDVIEHMSFEDAIDSLREMYRVLRPGGFLLVKTTPNTVFVRGIYPWAKQILRWIDREGVARIDQQLGIMRELHVDEYNYFSLRRVARMAGLPAARVWIDPDLTRSNRHRYSQAFSTNWAIRLVNHLGRLAVVRFFLGNDLYLLCRK